MPASVNEVQVDGGVNTVVKGRGEKVDIFRIRRKAERYGVDTLLL